MGDGHVNVFDAKTCELLNNITPPPPPHSSSAMVFSVVSAIVPQKLPPGVGENETLIFVCTSSNTMMLMNLQGQVVKNFSSGKKEKGDFIAMMPSPKGEWLYGIGEDQTLYSFNVSSGSLEGTMKLDAA